MKYGGEAYQATTGEEPHHETRAWHAIVTCKGTRARSEVSETEIDSQEEEREMSIDFQENNDPALIELMQQRAASKNFGVVDPEHIVKNLSRSIKNTRKS